MHTIIFGSIFSDKDSGLWKFMCQWVLFSTTNPSPGMIRTLKEIAFDFSIKAGYSIAFILLLVSYILTLYGNSQLMKQTAWIKQTNRSIQNLDGLVSGIKDAETGLRGYVNTNDTNFLESYKKSFVIVDTIFLALKKDTKDNIAVQKNLVTLSSLIRGKYDMLALAIDYFPKHNYTITDTLLQSFYKGQALMDRIKAIVNTMQKQEQALLELRTKKLDADYKALNAIIIASLILALLFAVIGFYTYRREYKARLLSDKKVDDYQKELKEHIKELGAANKELILMRRSEKFAATGRIARTIAHEVRNPLTNIDLAIAQIKNDMVIKDENSTMLFEMVTRNSQRINQLISELLKATRFAELSYISRSINTLLNEALELARDRVELNHITVEKKYEKDMREVFVDGEKLKIAFLNLIVNAIEAMEPGKGILQIHTKAEDNKCVIEICDNGYGMTDEQMNKLFEPYFTTKKNGNGLGLANTQNIILNHKGSINVNSKPGKGTTFIIKLDFVTPT
ncbi:MAG TPA: ATP-binding protein [Ferruginibacter sp.]|nr:ATP-binding protein [Ferruginibacter sp.]